MNGLFVKQVITALAKRGWIVAPPERNRRDKSTRVRFIHPFGFYGAQISWSDEDLRTHSSTEMLDRITKSILHAERIARLCPWPPSKDPGYPIELVAMPEHTKAMLEGEMNQGRMN